LIESAYQEQQPAETAREATSAWENSFIRLSGPIALEHLGDLGPYAGELVTPLCRFLQNPSPSVRSIGAYVLRSIGPAAIDAVPFLVSSLREAEASEERHESYVEALKSRTWGVTRSGGNSGGRLSRRLHRSKEDKQQRAAPRRALAGLTAESVAHAPCGAPHG
jgi:hypothetical protein